MEHEKPTVETKKSTTLERILVVEDTPQHLEDAKAYFATMPYITVTYATNFQDAKETIYKEEWEQNPEWYKQRDRLLEAQGYTYDDVFGPEEKPAALEANRAAIAAVDAMGIPSELVKYTQLVDGVISDLFFPYGNGMRDTGNEPNGLLIAQVCKEKNIPYVICTAGYHHGDKYEWPNRMLRTMGGTMIDHYDPNNRNAETKHKSWEEAHKALEKIVQESDDE